jgi:RNA polymerase sigma-70 factor (ECF subfamily)
VKASSFEISALDCLDSLLGYARHLARNADEAEDLVQEAYARLLTYRDRIKHPTDTRPLLFRILHNLFVDQYRSRQRGPLMVPVDELDECPPESAQHLADRSNPLSELLKGSLSDEMECALRTLDEGLRETLCLREIEDFTYEEISEILEIPIGTVRSRLSRARRAMARQLEKSLGAADPGDLRSGRAPRAGSRNGRGSS